MGFTTGVLGGATLTYSILYLTLYVHKANRNTQHTLLSQSHILLNSAVEPLPPFPDPPAYEVRKTSLTEELKDRWNGEIEHVVRQLQTTDWDEVRRRWERRIGNVFQRASESDTGRELVAAGDRLKDNAATAGDRLKDTVAAAADGAKDAAKNMKDNAATAGDRLKDTVAAAADGAKDAAKNMKDNVIGATEDAKNVAKDAKDTAVRKTTGKRLLEI